MVQVAELRWERFGQTLEVAFAFALALALALPPGVLASEPSLHPNLSLALSGLGVVGELDTSDSKAQLPVARRSDGPDRQDKFTLNDR
jgi:hypothetical protein